LCVCFGVGACGFVVLRWVLGSGIWWVRLLVFGLMWGSGGGVGLGVGCFLGLVGGWGGWGVFWGLACAVFVVVVFGCGGVGCVVLYDVGRFEVGWLCLG